MKDENNKLAKEKIANKKGLKSFWNQVSDKKSKRVSKKIINMEKKNIIDICTILDNCSIEEISKYLIKLEKIKIFQI